MNNCVYYVSAAGEGSVIQARRNNTMSDYYDDEMNARADYEAEMAMQAEAEREEEAEANADVSDLPAETLAMLERVRALDPTLADEMGRELAMQQYCEQLAHEEELADARNIANAEARLERARRHVGAVYRKHAHDPEWGPGERECHEAVADRLRAEDELLEARDPDAYAEQVYMYGKRNGIIGG
jgi:hypothetical protein